VVLAFFGGVKCGRIAWHCLFSVNEGLTYP